MGNSTVLGSLKLAAEAALQGDLELANSVLDAVGARVPFYDLSVVYDERGAMYQLPRFTYSTPTNILSEEELRKRLGGGAGSSTKRRGHVGAATPLEVTLRVSASTGKLEQDVKLTVASDTSVGELKSALHATLMSGACDVAASAQSRPNAWKGVGLPPPRQRVFLRGRELADDAIMQECGGGSGGGSMFQVFVRP